MKSYIINDSLLYLKEGKILKLQLLTLSVNIFQNIWYATIFTPKGTNKRQKVNIEMLILARHLIWIATDELPLSIQPLYVFPSLNSLCKRCTANNLGVVYYISIYFRYKNCSTRMKHSDFIDNNTPRYTALIQLHKMIW